jgi:hypothetical protein
MALLFWRRIHCHFCGARSAEKRRTGVTGFQCANCEAWNYLDGHDNIINTPAAAVASRQRAAQAPAFETFTRPTGQALQHQQNQPFCPTCQRNQQIYMETKANYLPDEEHPEYGKYVKALPDYLSKLEKRYPQVCKKCAPSAQLKINRADYFAGTDNVEKFGKRRKRERDDAFKQTARIFLRIGGWALYASLLLQVLWHGYGILNTVARKPVGVDGLQDVDYVVDPSQDSRPPDGIPSTHETEPVAGDDASQCPGYVFGASDASGTPYSSLNTPDRDSMACDDSLFSDCVFEPSEDAGTVKACWTQAMHMRLSDACFMTLAGFLPNALWLSAVLAWYNPHLKDLYHHTIRYESVAGQDQRRALQVILLGVRWAAYYFLSNPTFTGGLTTQQLLAAHCFLLLVIPLLQWLSDRSTRSVRFKVDFNMMPKPEDQDVLGQFAGPAPNQHSPAASSNPPSKLLSNMKQKRLEPFPIEKLAPQHRRNFQQPSPPLTDGDAMDIDWQPEMKPIVGNRQGLGWSGLRDEIYDIHDNMKQQQPKLTYQPPVQQNPFRGTLPPAPMSMERKLRNPPRQLTFKAVEPSKQSTFMQQMRHGIEAGKTFNRPPLKQEVAYEDDTEDDELSPAKARTRGQLDLKPSTWHLPSDTQETGLESLLGSSFRIADDPVLPTPTASTAEGTSGRVTKRLAVGLALVVGLGAMGWQVSAIRRPVCLVLADLLEWAGY